MMVIISRCLNCGFFDMQSVTLQGVGFGMGRFLGVRRFVLGLLLGGLIWVGMLAGGPSAIAQSNSINYTNTDLTGRSFVGEDLNGGVFVAAEMRDANLQGVNLKGAMFTKANLYGANLSDTDLTDALIDRVTLFKANLRNANLTGATLTSTVIQETDITNVDFTDALIDRYTVSLLCKIASGTNPVTGIDTRESLGCKGSL